MSWSVPAKYKDICEGSEDGDFEIQPQNQQFCRDLTPPKITLISSTPHMTTSRAIKLQAAMILRNQWDQQQHIKIKFIGGSKEDRDWVKDVVTRTFTPDLMNLQLEWLPDYDTRKSEVRISFEPNGSWSYLGKECLNIPQNEATMNFAWLDKPTDGKDGGVLEIKVIFGGVRSRQNCWFWGWISKSPSSLPSHMSLYFAGTLQLMFLLEQQILLFHWIKKSPFWRIK